MKVSRLELLQAWTMYISGVLFTFLFLSLFVFTFLYAELCLCFRVGYGASGLSSYTYEAIKMVVLFPSFLHSKKKKVG